MKMIDLIRYNIPADVVQLWRERESDVLLPLQEEAVKQHGLFEKGNLLIQAPTSSGKTFIGEMAAIQTALRRKKVVYVVPLKSLAEEKYLDFNEKYGRYGLRVIISTRDRREFDQDLERGDFSIAVVVYEKLSQLLVRRPERFEEVELVIADELELLSDPERGASVEVLLTRILRSTCRLIGLSAVIGRAGELAKWMDAELVFCNRRPSELRYGVLYEGEFKYRTYNECGEGSEAAVNVESGSTWEILTDNLCALVGGGESCLVFVKAKHESRQAAQSLAQNVDLAAANEAIKALRKLSPTRSRDCLIETLNNGVAFHNSDLSCAERRIVEKAFRDGEVMVMVSTSTLALGLNMPARNVFISSEKWRYDRRLGMPWKSPISHGEYENMGGRAGRYGSGHPFGRSILIASSPFEFETLWRRYVEGEREKIEPQICRDALEDHILELVASHTCITEEELLAFFESTLTGKWVWQELLTLEECEANVRLSVNSAVDLGMIVRGSNGGLNATPLGVATASKGIAISTAREMEYWIGESETRPWSDLDLILAAALSPDGRMLQVMLSAKEYEHGGYCDMLKRLTAAEDIGPNVPLNRIRNCNLMPFYEEVRAIKAALFLSEWIDFWTLADLEKKYCTMAGQIVSAADQIGWLVDATAAVGRALGANAEFLGRIRVLADRIQYGVREEALDLARLRAEPLSREEIMTLVSNNLYTPEAINGTSAHVLNKWLTSAQTKVLKVWAKKIQENDGEEKHKQLDMLDAKPVLIVDDRHPGQIILEDKTIQLQNKQYTLVRLLAACPGECVGYEEIYRAIWGEAIVEQNQMHFQKRMLLAAIKDAVAEPVDLVKTIPKRGFMLNLRPEQVMLRTLETSKVA